VSEARARELEYLLPRKSLWLRIKKQRAAYMIMVPIMICYLVFTLYPQVWVIAMGFFKYDGLTRPEYRGLYNFIRLFARDPIFWKSVLTTFAFAFGKLAIEIPMALVLAVILNSGLKGRGVFRAVFFLPHVTSLAVMSLVFYFIFAPYQGILNGILMRIGVMKQSFAWLDYGWSALLTGVLISVWMNFGINMILFLAGLQSIPPELYECARIDGANVAQQLLKITIPMLGKMLQIIVMLAIISSLKTFELFQVLTNGGPFHATEVMMLYVYKKFFGTGEGAGAVLAPQIGYASAVGFIVALIVAAVTAFYMLMSRRLDREA
jgi:raffinose/stachyose/melibiose transport system permease protein